MELNYRFAYETGDVYRMHERVASMFDEYRGTPGEPRVLWRLTHPWLIVQSPTIPDHTRLPAGYLAVQDHALGFGEPTVESKRIDHGLSRLRHGQVLRFKVVAAPTLARRRRGSPEPNRSVAILTREAQVGWLRRRGGTAFDVLCVDGTPDVRVADLGWTVGKKPTGEGETLEIKFPTIMFDGRLLVRDPVAMALVTARGVGDGKAFGFGLISLDPR